MPSLTQQKERERAAGRLTAPRDDDRFALSPHAALYVAFLECGYISDDALVMADYALAHPHKLLEDCKPSIAKAWKASSALSRAGEVEHG